MSETRQKYCVSDLPEDPNEDSLLPFSDINFKPPIWTDIRRVTHQHSLTGSEVAQLTGVKPRTVRKWLSPPEAENHSPMPYAAWRLLLIELDIVKPGVLKKHE